MGDPTEKKPVAKNEPMTEPTKEQPQDKAKEKDDPGTKQPGEKIAEKKEPPPEPKEKVAEKKEPGTDQPKDVAKTSGAGDPLVAKATQPTDSQYKDNGFRKFEFGLSKQELHEVIKLENLMPSRDPTLRSFAHYGWIPTANKGIIDEFFHFDNERLVGFGKLYLGDNKGYMEALVKEFGKASLDNTYAQVLVQAEVGQEEKASGTTRVYYYYFFPKTVAGICEVEMKVASTDYRWVELCVFERKWFEHSLDKHFADLRKALEEKKNAAALAKPAPLNDKLAEFAQGLSIRFDPQRIVKADDDQRLGEEAVPFEIIDPRLRAEMGKANSMAWVTEPPITTPRPQFVETARKSGFDRTGRFDKGGERKFIKMVGLKSQASVVYLEEEGKQRSYRRWTEDGWGEPSKNRLDAIKNPKATAVPLTATKYQTDLKHQVRILRKGVFAAFMYRSYALLAKEYFPSKEPTIRGFGTLKYGQNVNPYQPNYAPPPRLYEWRTEDGCEIGVSETAIHVVKGPVRTLD
jgi:hypothetical protein